MSRRSEYRNRIKALRTAYFAAIDRLIVATNTHEVQAIAFEMHAIVDEKLFVVRSLERLALQGRSDANER